MDWRRIGLSDRVAVVGTTGAGKSTLLRAMIASRPWVVLYDPKGEWEGEEWLTVREAAKLPRKPHPRIRYFPIPDELRDKEALDNFFWWAYYAKNLTVVVDEAYLATLAGAWLPPGYQACLAQGRSRGVAVWTATQRPYKIPQTILSEVEHWFVFRLNAPQDRWAVHQWTGLDPRLISPENLPKRVWYYVSEGQVYGPYQLRLE